MLDFIKRINIELAKNTAVSMIVFTIVVHGLVILKKIPYTWINGGRSLSYESQKRQSIAGIIMLIIAIPCLLTVSSDIILWILVCLLAISTVMQLLGTHFERYVMSVVVFILLICILRMAL